MRAVFARHFFRRGHARAVDQRGQLAQRLRLLHGGQAIGLAGDVAAHESTADFARHGLAFVGLQVGHDHPAACSGQHARRAFAQTRRAACDDERPVFDLHVL